MTTGPEVAVDVPVATVAERSIAAGGEIRMRVDLAAVLQTEVPVEGEDDVQRLAVRSGRARLDPDPAHDRVGVLRSARRGVVDRGDLRAAAAGVGVRNSFWHRARPRPGSR